MHIYYVLVIYLLFSIDLTFKLISKLINKSEISTVVIVVPLIDQLMSLLIIYVIHEGNGGTKLENAIRVSTLTAWNYIWWVNQEYHLLSVRIWCTYDVNINRSLLVLLPGNVCFFSVEDEKIMLMMYSLASDNKYFLTYCCVRSFEHY